MDKKIDLVYMAAGMSSRFGGKIKQFAEVGPNGEKLIEYSIKQALPAGFARIVFIVGNMTEKPFKEFFGTEYQGMPVEYALQIYDPKERDKPWGAVDALCSIQGIVNNSFVICNGDDLYGPEAFRILVDHLRKSDDNALIGYKLSEVLPDNGTVNRGICKLDAQGCLSEIEEVFNIAKNNLSEKSLREDSFASMNIIGLHPKTMGLLCDKLKLFKEKNQGDRKVECLLPSEISSLLKEGLIRIKLYVSNEKWIGITNPEDVEIVKNAIVKKASSTL